jgi:tetratricopeptide (TPR) repeat protein
MESIGAFGLLASAIVSVTALVRLSARSSQLARRWREGSAALSKRDYPEAERAFRETLGLASGRFGPSHWRIAFHVAALAEALAHQAKHDEAAKYLQRALALHDAQRAQPHAQWPYVLIHAARVEAAKGDFGRAMRHIRRARDEAYDKRMLADVLRVAASLHIRQQQYGEALDVMTELPRGRVVPTDVRSLGELSRRALHARDLDRALRGLLAAERYVRGAGAAAFYRAWLGELLASQKRDEEARGHLEKSVRGYEHVGGEQHPALAHVLVVLAEVCARLGELEAASRAATRAAALPCMRVEPGGQPYRSEGAGRDPLAEEKRRAKAVLAYVAQPRAT